ncbi:MAG: phosphoadenosine phosphosulfate reductase family protein, partial [Verrucomicrobiota bacterium]
MTLHAGEISPEEVRDLAAQFETASLTDILRWAWERFGKRAAIGTSFQGAGLVMIHHAVQAGLPFPIFTLDTQLLFKETYELQKRLEAFFELQIETLLPDQTPEQQEVEE